MRPGSHNHNLRIPAIAAMAVFAVLASPCAFAADMPLAGQPAGNSSVPPAQPDLAHVEMKSLMFTQGEMEQLGNALNAYLNNEEYMGEGGALSDLFGKPKDNNAAAAKRYYTYPQFFLESIVYHSPQDWSVWINSQKITQKTPTENAELVIEEIDKSHVVIRWHPVAMDKVLETWERTRHDGVHVDRSRREVVFTLHLNQTFSSYVMRVLEGKVLPVTVEDVSKNPASKRGAGNAASSVPTPELPAMDPNIPVIPTPAMPVDPSPVLPPPDANPQGTAP